MLPSPKNCFPGVQVPKPVPMHVGIAVIMPSSAAQHEGEMANIELPTHRRNCHMLVMTSCFFVLIGGLKTQGTMLHLKKEISHVLVRLLLQKDAVTT